MQTEYLREFVELMDREQVHMFGIAIQKGGKLVDEYRWEPDVPHQLYSMSKSYTSMAVGIAIGEGRFGLDDRVADFFPEYDKGDISDLKKKTTVRHLLTMAAGHTQPVLMGGRAEELVNKDFRDPTENDWARAFLKAEPDHEPGTNFVYDSGCTYMLGRIVEKTSGEDTRDYLVPRLFEPLGIETPEWDRCPTGHSLCGSGLHLRTKQSLAFGQMLLQGGEYGGRQLVPAEWVKEATTFKIATDRCGFFPDKALGYGYQFWMARHGAYRASGAHGQGCFVVPYQDAVICYNAHTPKMQTLLEGLWDLVIPRL
ncbi:MAG: serine hydrolase [Firmicutes bacterium]|nr:serine hydrolase [Bacillota bacterium]